jgi:hypothetical protein
MSVKKQKDSERTEASGNPDVAQDHNKRKTVGKVAATAGLVASMSGNWQKPVLSSVVLPAHARTTSKCTTDGQSFDGCDGTG